MRPSAVPQYLAERVRNVRSKRTRLTRSVCIAALAPVGVPPGPVSAGNRLPTQLCTTPRRALEKCTEALLGAIRSRHRCGSREARSADHPKRWASRCSPRSFGSMPSEKPMTDPCRRWQSGSGPSRGHCRECVLHRLLTDVNSVLVGDWTDYSSFWIGEERNSQKRFQKLRACHWRASMGREWLRSSSKTLSSRPATSRS